MTLQGRMLAGRYELGSLLGAGGMASVHRAHDRVLERVVAVKVLGLPYAEDAEVVARFAREARAAAGLSHPNVVAVFDSGSEQDTHYIVMEYVNGESLAETIGREGVLAPRLAVEIAGRVCAGLSAAHEAGLVHRDVKPGNVLVSRAGMVKVTDFGIATATDMPALASSRLGTAGYVSPEQVQDQPVDARSDVYSLGCVLYELLAGAPPFVGGSPAAVVARHLRELPEPLSRRNPGIPVELDRVVMTALAKQPARRYQSATNMAEDLARVAAGLATGDAAPRRGGVGAPTDRLPDLAIAGPPPTVVVAARAARAAARRPARMRWTLAAGVVVVGLLAAALLWPHGGGSPPGQGTDIAGPATTRTTSSAGSTSTLPQPTLPSALADLAEAVMAGERQGTVDPPAEDLVHQAEEVVRAVQGDHHDDHEDDAPRKLADLERKVDQLIRRGRIRPPAAGQIRQAVARLAQVVTATG